jgi:hypothetical protein
MGVMGKGMDDKVMGWMIQGRMDDRGRERGREEGRQGGREEGIKRGRET